MNSTTIFENYRKQLVGDEGMKVNVGELIKNLRKNMGVSQKELAEKLFISQRKLSRIETGEGNINMMEFLTAFSILGFSIDDFWVIYLDNEEFQGYKLYKTINRLLRNGDIDAIKHILPSFKENPLTKQPLIAQFQSLICLMVDNKIEENEKLVALYSVLRQTIDDFDDEKIKTYCFSYNEIMAINEIALSYDRLGKRDKAIKLLAGTIDNIDNSRTSKGEKEVFLPKILVDLYKLLMDAGEYKRAAAICKSTLKMGERYHNLHFFPEAVYSLGVCYQKMGKDNEEYLPLWVRAYHAARGIGQNDLANMIRKEQGIL